MAQSPNGWTLGRLAEALGGVLCGPSDRVVSRPVPADSDEPDGIAFAGTRAFLDVAEKSGVGSLLVPPDLAPCTKPHIVVENPRAAFAQVLSLWKRPLPLDRGCHPTASIDPGALVDPSASIGANCVIERGAKIGPNARVHALCYIGENCEVGEGCVLYPSVVLVQDVRLGPRTIVHSGAVLGADGFGYEWDGEKQFKVPQIGSVELGSDVEVGANAAIDRATSGTTELGDGTKIDNLVQIAHNVRIGENTVIAALSGISGSTQIGDRVIMGGSVATSHRVKICSDAVLGGRTGATSDIDEPGQYFGTPARPMQEALRAALLVYRLPEILSRLKKLEAKLEEDDKEAE